MSPLPRAVTDSHVWQQTLALTADEESRQPRERLRTAFLTFRERADLLAKEIRGDVPQLTLHDITHIDALWETASTILGRDFTLTPTEGFVLGGAFLLHDLGMALPSVEGGISTLTADRRWKDSVTYEYQTRYGRAPSSDEIESPESDIYDQVLLTLLRQIHAASAERLVSTPFKAKGDDPIYLIDDLELRQNFGQIIGSVAHSHWWPLSELEKQFQRTRGAPHWCPRTWTLDPLRVACALRCADAAQVDARRAPTLLRAVSELPILLLIIGLFKKGLTLHT